jgi:hypothetical protein
MESIQKTGYIMSNMDNCYRNEEIPQAKAE